MRRIESKAVVITASDDRTVIAAFSWYLAFLATAALAALASAPAAFF